MRPAEQIARAFHEVYEELAPQFGYKTRNASAVPWQDVPENNRALMLATVQKLLDSGVIHTGLLDAEVTINPPEVRSVIQQFDPPYQKWMIIRHQLGSLSPLVRVFNPSGEDITWSCAIDSISKDAVRVVPGSCYEREVAKVVVYG